jgi:hypothetical protein
VRVMALGPRARINASDPFLLPALAGRLSVATALSLHLARQIAGVLRVDPRRR